jgi:hypothetical protein
MASTSLGASGTASSSLAAQGEDAANPGPATIDQPHNESTSRSDAPASSDSTSGDSDDDAAGEEYVDPAGDLTVYDIEPNYECAGKSSVAILF